VLRDHQRARQDLLRGRQHLHAGGEHAPLKAELLQYTNETRLAIEDASQHSGIRFLAACNGATAGGGYELALACDEMS